MEDKNSMGDCLPGKMCPITNIESLDDCKAQCTKETGCKALVYNKNKQCYLNTFQGPIVDVAKEHGTISCTPQSLRLLVLDSHTLPTKAIKCVRLTMKQAQSQWLIIYSVQVQSDKVQSDKKDVKT